MRKSLTIASIVAVSMLAFAPAPALAEPYDECVEQCIADFLTPPNGDAEGYERCRRDCERRFPPQLTLTIFDAKLD
jgi:hypothetical protein